MRFRLPLICLLGLLCVLQLSCDAATPTQIFLHANADALTRQRSAFLRAIIVSQEGEDRLRHEFPVRGEAAHEWPIDLSILPLGGDASRRVTVTVGALDATQTVSNARTGRHSFLVGQLFEASIVLQDACIGVDCMEGSTCDGGACVPIDSIPIQLSEDDQEGACHSNLCWEHPRPAGGGAIATCSYGEGESAGGAVIVAGNVGWLEDGIWTLERVWENDAPRDITCWGDRQGVVVSPRRVAVRESGGWRDMPLPDGDAAFVPIAVWAPGPEEFWVVGLNGAVVRYRNGRWAPVPETADLTADFSEVDGDESVVRIFGEGVHLRYDRTAQSFSDLPLPPGVTEARAYVEHDGLRAVIGGTNLYLQTGNNWSDAYRGATSGSAFGFVSLAAGGERFYAGAPRGRLEWRTATEDWVVGPNLRGASINHMSATGDLLVAAGDNGAVGVLQGDRWMSGTVLLSRGILNDIAGDGDGDFLAVGDGGAILQRESPGIWRRRVVLEVDDTTLSSSFQTAAHDGSDWWIAGGNDAVFHSADGIVWSADRPAGTAQWRDLCVEGSSLLLVGSDGAAQERTDGAWRNLVFPSDAALTACMHTGTGWLVGDENGQLYRTEGERVLAADAYGGAITQLTLASNSVAVVAGGSLFHADRSGVCAAACEADDVPGDLRQVLLDGDAILWARTHNGVQATDGPLHRAMGIPNGIVPSGDDDGSVLVVGENASIVRIQPPR